MSDWSSDVCSSDLRKAFRYGDRQEQKVVMGYFISHIGVILIAGVIIALIGLAAVLMAAKNAETRSPEETDERLHAFLICWTVM